MSDFRKLLLAFAGVTLFAGIASAGSAPALNTTASPLTVTTDAIAPEITQMNLKENPLNEECNTGLQTAPGFLIETSVSLPFFTDNTLGSPAITPASNIASFDTGQTTLAAGTIAVTPASTFNDGNTNNHRLVSVGNPAADSSSVFNAANTVASPGQAVVAPNFVANTADISAGQVTNVPVSAPAQVARTAPINAGKNAG